MTYQSLMENLALKKGWTISRNVDVLDKNKVSVKLVVVKDARLLANIGVKGAIVQITLEEAYKQLLEYWVNLGVQVAKRNLNK